MRLYLYTLLLFVFSAALFESTAADSYTISLFATSPPGNDILSNVPAAISLRQSLSPEQILSPSRPREGSVIVRGRLADNTYGLFSATMALSSADSLYSFSYPQSITFERIVRTKLFADKHSDSDKDIPLVIFGAQKIHLLGNDTAFLRVDDYWFGLSDHLNETGALFVQSQPTDARIIIDGKQTDRTTPSIIEGIAVGEHVIEVSIPEYLFSRKKVMISADSVVSVSFQLISSMDTAYVEGTLRLGVLQLPTPPIEAPFVIDGREVEGAQVTLNEGKHRVEWFGGDRYSSLDTVVEVFLGKVTTFAFAPKRLTGEIELIPDPADARILMGEELLGYGVQARTLPTGEYSFTIDRKLHYPQTQRITIYPDDKRLAVIKLQKVPDRDEDGFLDSLDKCPDTYGLYGGCPKPPFKEALRLNGKRILDNMKDDPLHFSINPFSIIYRQPTNKRFRHLLSYFSDGKHFLNNHKGVAVANSYTVSMRGLIASVELGQWNSGLVSEKTDTLRLKGKSGDTYAVIYDSLAGVNPTIFIPSTAVSAGVHFITQWFNFGYLIGYQWEDIELYDLLNLETGELTTVRFNNDWWFHRFLIETEFSIGEWFSPTLYTSFSLPIGKSPRTGWHSFQTGLRFRFTPSKMIKRTDKYSAQHTKRIEANDDDIRDK